MKVTLSKLLILCSLALGGTIPLEAASHIPKNVFLRDAEIEQALKEYVSPIFKVAGLDPRELKIFIFHSTEVNAAAGLGYTMMINTGLIMKSDNVGQLIGVLAHETGHLAGRHNERLLNMGNQSIIPMLGALLLGGAATALSGDATPALAGVLAGMEVSENKVLAYQRGHEAAADQAAFKFMEKLGWSSGGFLEFMEILHKQEMLSTERQYAYKRTHPFMIDRMRLVERHCKHSPHTNTNFPPDFERKFNRIKTKIEAFTDSPRRVLQRNPPSNTCIEARYARAIAYHQSSQTASAMNEIDQLINESPDDAFFLELKGQILFETGQIEPAIVFYKKAIAALPDNALLKLQLAQILLESKTGDKSGEVITLLDKARDAEGDSPNIWRLYATAYGRQKQDGMVTLMLAEEAVQMGDIESAHRLADKAITQLPKAKTSGIQRAHDIKTLEFVPKSIYD